jgi:hypothetical protein
MSRPRFAIYSVWPNYDFRDALCGTSLRQERAFNTYAFASRICGQMNQHDFDHGGDGTTYEVRVWHTDQWGACYRTVYRDPDQAAAEAAEYAAHLATIADDEIPF